MGQRIALIDADYMIYRCGFAIEHREWIVVRDDRVLGTFDDQRKAKDAAESLGGVLWSRREYEDVSHALGNVRRSILDVADAFEKKFGHEPELQPWLTGSGNFRDKIATIRVYKGNRDPRHRPKFYREIRDYLIARWGAQLAHDMEADDAVAIGQTADPEHTVICGIDKDLLQVPGRHYNLDKQVFGVVKPRTGLLLFYLQLLMGDSVDNIPGVYKLGKVGANRIVKAMRDAHKDVSFEELHYRMYQECTQQYAWSIAEFGGEACGYSDPEAACLENAQLLWLLRTPSGIFIPPEKP